MWDNVSPGVDDYYCGSAATHAPGRSPTAYANHPKLPRMPPAPSQPAPACSLSQYSELSAHYPLIISTYTPCLAHVVTRLRTWLFLPHFYPFLTDMVAMKKKRQWYSVTCRGGRVLTVPGPACRILFVKWSVRVPLSSPAPVASSGKITISKELMLGCINKNSFRLLLISLQIVKANDSYLPLCSLMIFLK